MVSGNNVCRNGLMRQYIGTKLSEEHALNDCLLLALGQNLRCIANVVSWRVFLKRRLFCISKPVIYFVQYVEMYSTEALHNRTEVAKDILGHDLAKT